MAYGGTKAGTSGTYSQSGVQGASRIEKFMGERGLMCGNYDDPTQTVIDYVQIGQTSGATDFAELNVSRYSGSGLSNGSRAVWGGGQHGPGGGEGDSMDYNTIGTFGAGTDFGNLTEASGGAASYSDGSRGLFSCAAAGYNAINIAVASNAVTFGSMHTVRTNPEGASDGSRGVMFGGETPPVTDAIEYTTIGIFSDALDFGELTQARAIAASCSNGSRAIYSGGTSIVNTIDYVDIGRIGDSLDFGDLFQARSWCAASSNGHRGITAAGSTPPRVDTIDYVNIGTAMNALDFGNRTVSHTMIQATSGD